MSQTEYEQACEAPRCEEEPVVMVEIPEVNIWGSVPLCQDHLDVTPEEKITQVTEL